MDPLTDPVGDALPLVRAVLVVAAANTAPLLGKKLLPRWTTPLDGGFGWADGRPMLGPSKTVRGVVFAVAAAGATAAVLDAPVRVGLLAGLLAIIGDALASFAKRRLGVPPSSPSPGLDQLPESLLPLLALHGALGVSATQALLLCVVFAACQPPLARLWYRLGWRDEPY